MILSVIWLNIINAMRITKGGLFLVASIILLSVLIASILNSISVDYESEDLQKLQATIMDNNKIPLIDNSPEHLMWFAQISDLHLSIFQDKERGTELLEFCDYTMEYINPSIILATGDLTDAKKQDFIGSSQFEEEWKKYKDILDTCKTTKNIPWLDIRGNHDNFDVPSILSSRNYYRNYSMQGRRHSRSYIYNLAKGSEKYAFIGVDACPAVGLKRPFNFIGVLPESEIEELNKLSASANDANYTIWFGHYPTSCILSRRPGVRSVIGADKRSIVYLCGHFHAMLGLVPNMYTVQKNGFFELELADWKDNRMYRVAAIDHGLFSFVDVKHKDWPVVLVTNPKSALLQSPWREPLNAMLYSTHVRILVFSPSEVLSVRVKIDDEPWDHAIPSGGPLFSIAWKPSKFSSGLHEIKVAVLDKHGREKTITHPFTLDGTKLKLKFLPRILLMLNFSAVMQVMYGLSLVVCIIPFCIPRYLNKQSLEKKTYLPAFTNKFMRRWLRRVWLISNIDSFFFPIMLYPLYICIGPWAIAEVLDGQYGVIFIWGIFVGGSYVPGSFTYGYAFLQLFLFHFPLVLFIAYSLERRLLNKPPSGNKVIRIFKVFGSHMPYLILLGLQLLMAYAFYLAYGLIAVISGPIRLWPILLILWVWYQSEYISSQKLRTALRVLDRSFTSTIS